MERKRPNVLFQTEGSYPYSGGGVSTWSHILCTELNGKVDFEIMAVTGNPYVEARYRVPHNVKNIIHIPLWGVDEPSDYYDSQRSFSHQIEKKARSTHATTKKYFKPLFDEFIKILFNPYSDVTFISEILYGFWKYFQHYDYKQTMRQTLLWDEFKEAIFTYYEESDLSSAEQPRVLDLTFGMRWLYHFLMPVAVTVSPKTDLTHATLAGFPALVSIAAKYEYGIPSLVTDHGVYMR